MKSAKYIIFPGVYTALLICTQLILSGVSGIELVTILLLCFCYYIFYNVWIAWKGVSREIQCKNPRVDCVFRRVAYLWVYNVGQRDYAVDFRLYLEGGKSVFRCLVLYARSTPGMYIYDYTVAFCTFDKGDETIKKLTL